MAKPKETAPESAENNEPKTAPEPTEAERRAESIKSRRELLIAAGTPVAAASMLAEQAEDNAALAARLEKKGGK